MTTMTRLAFAAAVVVALGVAWVTLGPSGGIGGPRATPTAIPTPVASPSDVVGLNPNGILAPGTWHFEYARTAGADASTGPDVMITIPSTGWTNFEGFAADKNYGGLAGPSFLVWHIFGVEAQPCTTGDPVLATPSPGPTVDDLISVLGAQTGVAASKPVDVTIDGFVGKSIELTVPSDITACTAGFYPFSDKFAQDPNEVERIYVLDVQGARFTFFLRIPARTTPADLAELQGIVDSVHILP